MRLFRRTRRPPKQGPSVPVRTPACFELTGIRA